MTKETTLENLRLILNFDRSNLKKTSTIITSPDGKVLREEKSESGGFQTTECHIRRHGMVIDEKPDLQLAQFRRHLFISSQDPAIDRNLLLQNNITHILNTAGLKEFFPQDFIYKSLTLYDFPDFKISDVFDDCFEFINDALKHQGSVLIHCNAGVSRSATIAIAYVMVTEKIRFLDALQQLKKIRPQILPNSGFTQQLIRLEKKMFDL